MSLLVSYFSECLDVMINLADKVRQKGFTSVSLLNLGGGLGIDYRRHVKHSLLLLYIDDI